jgi:CheY-like chemotaxis protein/anti-sigma regulatory factor (Ser/Thr protein kinase)
LSVFTEYFTDESILEAMREMTILIVEDEHTAMAFLRRTLEPSFKAAFIAENGLKALEVINENHIDIVFTDYNMPVMNGLELVRNMARIKAECQVIMITAVDEKDVILAAINQRISQFIIKPIQHKRLCESVEVCVKQAITEKLREKTRRQEMELLLYKEKYHARQQEHAREKENNIIRNDLQSKVLTLPSGERWLFSIFHESADILCGDSYSVRKLDDTKVFLFIIDAMGKGISASMTTVMAVSMLNHMVDKAIEKGNFKLKILVDSFLAFLQKYLLEEEIICASFLLFDFGSGTVETARFSMPKLVVVNRGYCQLLKSGNMPVTKYTSSYNAQEFRLGDVSALIVMTDGLAEAGNGKGMTREGMDMLMCSSRYLSELEYKCRRENLIFEDDATAVFVKKLSPDVFDWCEEIVVNACFNSIAGAVSHAAQFLERLGYAQENICEFSTVLTEILMNAFEHGCLGINREEKDRLISLGEYDDFLRCATADNTISLIIAGFDEDGISPLTVTATDPGEGFNPCAECGRIKKNTSYCGRGLRLVGKMTDEIFFNTNGNQVTFVKMVKRRYI